MSERTPEHQYEIPCPRTPTPRLPESLDEMVSPDFNVNLLDQANMLQSEDNDQSEGLPKTPHASPVRISASCNLEDSIVNPAELVEVMLEEMEFVPPPPFLGIPLNADANEHWSLLRTATESDLVCDDTIKPWIIMARRTRERLAILLGDPCSTWPNILEAAREHMSVKYFDLLGRVTDTEDKWKVNCVGFEEDYRCAPDGLDHPSTIEIPDSLGRTAIVDNVRNFEEYDSQNPYRANTWKKIIVVKTKETCRTCGEAFDSTVARDFHRAMVHQWGPNVCSFCGLYTTQRDRMCKICHLRADRAPLDVLEAVGVSLLTVAVPEKKRRIEFGLQQIHQGHEVLSDLDLHNQSKGRPRGKQAVSTSGISSASSSSSKAGPSRSVDSGRKRKAGSKTPANKESSRPTVGMKVPKQVGLLAAYKRKEKSSKNAGEPESSSDSN